MDVFSGLARFSGSIELNNKGPTFLTYCPSKNNLDLTMTPEDILHYLCTLQGYSIHEAIFINRYLLDLLGLKDLKQTLISKLSVDNQRKLSLAICAIGNPNIILLDNITAGLDESSKKTIIEFIQTLKKWNKTVLITSYR
ncbi:ATP-binding cassette sub-family A member 8-B [Thelohanellus kitauei]|uniref:ATP-binding cassette sub-family A member 8-B n=1 Tax=Thelohanellus kitauei TaxID=669202 RepID=A0A0C2JQ50_THEKT|nr:ATP-binding cassette sub-family A member 8-B [Thelohanellus kitauei]